MRLWFYPRNEGCYTSFPIKYPLHSKFKKERTYCTHYKITENMLDTYFKAGNAKAPIYSHCNLNGHTMEKCYKLHGYPPGHKLFTKSRGAYVLAVQLTSTLLLLLKMPATIE
jgi:hypothetical protein